MALKAFVYGRVQGVYFRDFADRHARQLGLTGYVRNLPDRSVEVYAEGDRQYLERLLEVLKEGPPGARVDNLEISWAEPTGKFKHFSITR